MKKRCLSALLTLLLLFSVGDPAVFASEEPDTTASMEPLTEGSAEPAGEAESPNEEELQWFSLPTVYNTGIEPCGDTADELSADLPVSMDGIAVYTSKADAAAYIRDCLKNHVSDPSFTISMPLSFMSEKDADKVWALYNELLSLAWAHTGQPFEGDHLRRVWHHRSGQYACKKTATSWELTFRHTYTYNITLAQDLEYQSNLMSLVDGMDLNGKSDYEKVCAVYDYITAHVTYDHEHLGNSDYRLQYTAYAALKDGAAVCNGIAWLFYCMALYAGVDARFITGPTSEGRHGWNIVRIDGLYYNLDATWDLAEYTSVSQTTGKPLYRWFLLSDGDFYDHTREEDFTGDFYTAYPMSETSYTGVHWQLKDTVLYVHGTGSTEGIAFSTDCYDFAESLVVEEGVTELFQYTFYKFTNLKTVSFPSTLTAIGSYAFCDNAALTEISLPDSVTTLKSQAFLNCSSLQKVSIGSGLTNISNNPFTGCVSLSSFSVSADNPIFFTRENCLLKTAGTETVLVCADLSHTGEYTLPSGITELGFYSLHGSQAQTIIVPSGVKKSVYAFCFCHVLEDIWFPETTTSITENSYGCNTLQRFHVSADNPKYSDRDGLLYNKTGTSLMAYPWGRLSDTLIIPDGTLTVGNNALLQYNKTVKTVILPEGMTKLGAGALERSTVEKVYLPASLTQLGTNALNTDNLTVFGESGSYAEEFVTLNGSSYTGMTFVTRTPGDANIDGTLNAADLVRMAADLASGTCLLKFADADENGTFDLLDLVHIMKVLAA